MKKKYCERTSVRGNGSFTGCKDAEANQVQTVEAAKVGTNLYIGLCGREDEPQAKVIKEAISKYEKDTGVKVDVQFKGRTGQREGLEPALSAKQQIDLFDEDVKPCKRKLGKILIRSGRYG